MSVRMSQIDKQNEPHNKALITRLGYYEDRRNGYKQIEKR
ncbi:hypothetical protein GCM10008018_58900 [Paenibacillus marchantiophytorum]|uniref:Uncharacterized protein n=1 Tax=Paenibacillus marchantiophytorum TaxID=1619310 RepID=A0ABQ1FBF7_9BACL|nr:hypothetical protein GCM10008018_58900 [Paenibacillus marchantiophytorum]